MIDPLSQTINAPHKGQFIVMLVPNVIISFIRLSHFTYGWTMLG